jgi:hypothetical protein
LVAAAVAVVVAVPGALASRSQGYVRLSQGDIASFIGTGLSCVVETVDGNPSQVAVIGGSYWVSLQLPDDVVVATASNGRPLAKAVYSRPSHPMYRTAIGVPGFRVLPVLPPKLINVHDSGIWCSAQVSRTIAPGQQIVACYLTATNGQPRNGSYGFVVSPKLVAVVRVHGNKWQIVWSHKQ